MCLLILMHQVVPLFLTIDVVTQQPTTPLPPPPPLHTQPLQLTHLPTQQPLGNEPCSGNSATSHTEHAQTNRLGPGKLSLLFFLEVTNVHFVSRFYHNDVITSYAPRNGHHNRTKRKLKYPPQPREPLLVGWIVGAGCQRCWDND
jgi:hypothetical protein